MIYASARAIFSKKSIVHLHIWKKSCIFVPELLCTMKKPVKIALWIVGSLIVLVAGALLSVNIWASRLVQNEVRKAFVNMPDADAQLGNVYIDLLSGSAIVRDITFCTYSLALEDTVSGVRQPGLALHIPTLAIWNINYMELWKNHHLSILKITVDEPKLLVYLDEKNPGALMPVFPKDTTLNKAGAWLRLIDVRHIELKELDARLHSTRSPLNLSVDDLSTDCYDIRYDLIDSLFSYNDSVYALSLEACKIKLPDGRMDLEVHDLKTRNQGKLSLGYTRVRHIISAKRLADIMREPTTWIDLELNSLHTSPLNPIRKVLTQDCTLDALDVDVRRLHVCRDARHAPKVPYRTPQEFLRTLPVIFTVKQVKALAHKVDVEFSSTDINCGELHLKNIRAQLKNITNRPGAIWYNTAKAPFGEKGQVEAQYNIHMNKAADFDIKIKGTNIETHDVNSFLRPLVGMTCDCHIDDIDAVYSGNKTTVKGEFCMQYHGLKVKIYKEDDIPYKVITKNASSFTSFANTLIPKSNPTSVDPAPRRYDVEWQRDEWKPYPLYLFGPVIDGVMKTMLPGLFVHKQTKKKK